MLKPVVKLFLQLVGLAIVIGFFLLSGFNFSSYAQLPLFMRLVQSLLLAISMIGFACVIEKRRGKIWFFWLSFSLFSLSMVVQTVIGLNIMLLVLTAISSIFFVASIIINWRAVNNKSRRRLRIMK
jgi:hypothetical protein